MSIQKSMTFHFVPFRSCHIQLRNFASFRFFTITFLAIRRENCPKCVGQGWTPTVSCFEPKDFDQKHPKTSCQTYLTNLRTETKMIQDSKILSLFHVLLILLYWDVFSQIFFPQSNPLPFPAPAVPAVLWTSISSRLGRRGWGHVEL